MNRSVWIDDSGSGADGSVINNAELQKIYDNVELEIASPNFPAVKTYQAIDAIMAVGLSLGGDSGRYRRNIATPVGVTYDLLAPGTGIFRVDPAWLTGTWKWEAVLRVEPGATAGTEATAFLVDLTNAPDAAITGSTITSQSTTGQLVRSGTLVFTAGGATRDLGVKIRTNNANFGANLAWSRFFKAG